MDSKHLKGEHRSSHAEMKSDVDKGWAWLVLVAVYSGILILSTSLFTAGVMYVALLDYYDEDAVKTSIIGSLNSGLLCLLGPFVSVIMDTFSCRTSMFVGGLLLSISYVASAFVNSIDLLILFVGVIGGLGNAMTSLPFVVVIAYYFEKRRKFFIALSQAVIGLAMFLASPMALALLDNFGVKGTFIITGGICAQLCVCAVICKPSLKERQLKQEKLKISRKSNNANAYHRKILTHMLTLLRLDLLKNIPFLSFLLSTMTWNFMLSVCLMHLPNYIVTKGLASSNITIVMTIFGASNTIGRFLGALSVNQNSVSSITLHVVVMTIGGALTMSFPVYSSLSAAAYVFAAFTGVFTGVPNSLLTPITLHLVGLEQISSAHGLEYFFSGIGFISGPPIAGLLYERTRAYENSFMLSGGVLLSGSALALFTCISLRRQHTYDEKSEKEITIKDQELPMVINQD